MISHDKRMPGRNAPASFLFGAVLAAMGMALAVPAQAQMAQGGYVPLEPGRAVPPPPSAQPVPSEVELVKMIWSVLIGVDQANRSGNYSVLRDMSATAFQVQNDAARLAQAFAPIRNSGIDLTNALLIAPTYQAAPQLVAADVLHVRGAFALRPATIVFDLYFQWEQGRWKIYGISIQPSAMNTQLPGAPQAQPAQVTPPKGKPGGRR